MRCFELQIFSKQLTKANVSVLMRDAPPPPSTWMIHSCKFCLFQEFTCFQSSNILNIFHKVRTFVQCFGDLSFCCFSSELFCIFSCALKKVEHSNLLVWTSFALDATCMCLFSNIFDGVLMWWISQKQTKCCFRHFLVDLCIYFQSPMIENILNKGHFFNEKFLIYTSPLFCKHSWNSWTLKAGTVLQCD